MENLKFRIWDEDNECFDFIDLLEIAMTIETLDSIRDYFRPDYLKTNNNFIQKHTGLNDKNDVGIFEGDILKFYVGCRGLRKVIFQSGAFGVVGVKDDREKTFTEFIPFAMMNQNLIDHNIYDEINSLIEVVGNIHENPELLK
ncbi:YopX family protein [Chryseobacterium indologenes]|uniref:YopX family protein n=1 Tax=Chryseobacterium indologenes TaxID=253 RepID=UPI0016265771|nr:YopX family protein [Chryseobacterium indologenes]